MADLVKLEDTLSGTLTALLASGETASMSVSNPPSSVTEGWLIVNPDTTGSEKIKFTGVAGNTLTGLTRGVGGSAKDHMSGSPYELRYVSEYQNEMVDSVKAEHNDDGTHKETALDSMITGTEAQGDLIYHNGTIWTRLAAGTNGYFLKTQGAGANPTWATVSSVYTGTDDGWIAAGETWTYASADDPTFTFTITGDKSGKYSAGMRVKLTQNTAKYFIITKVEVSTDTTITVYGGTDYDLAEAAITSPYYSTQKAPLGFPLDPTKWTVETTDTQALAEASPAQNTWYNLGSLTISIPIGVWRVMYEVNQDVSISTATVVDAKATLSTANNSESDAQLTAYHDLEGASGTLRLIHVAHREKVLTLTAKTPYYLNAATTTASVANLRFRGDVGTTIIRAICSYL